MNIWRIHKYYFYRFMRLRGNPRALAGGTAIGVFIGLTPTIPFHTILIIALALATRSSVIAGIIVSWIVCNPITSLPIYYSATVLGNMFTPYSLDLEKLTAVFHQVMQSGYTKNSMAILWDLGYESIVILIVGGCTLATPLAIVSYYLAFQFFLRLQLNRRNKQVLD